MEPRLGLGIVPIVDGKPIDRGQYTPHVNHLDVLEAPTSFDVHVVPLTKTMPEPPELVDGFILSKNGWSDLRHLLRSKLQQADVPVLSTW